MRNFSSFGWTLGVLVLLGGCTSAAQGPVPPPPAVSSHAPGVVLVAQLTGRVELFVAGQRTSVLRVDDSIPQGARIATGASSSIVLVFSNGAVVSLGGDSELVVAQFSQGPFGGTVRLNEMQEEPSVSITQLELVRGELVGNVKKLRYAQGSSFIIRTPVGAAGIRGTIFRIVFRPSGRGGALFNLSTVQGLVEFQRPQPVGTAGAVMGGLRVPQGQEIVIQVDVQPTATGQGVVTLRNPGAVGATPISTSTLSAVTQVASQMVQATTQVRLQGPRAAPAPASRAAPLPPPPSSELPDGPITLSAATRYFETWGGYAVWQEERTEFTVTYRSATGLGRQCFEVRREAGRWTVREIPVLTRPLLDHGRRTHLPIEFTEPAEVRADYYRTHPEAQPGRFEEGPGGATPLPPKAPAATVVTPIDPALNPPRKP